MRLISFHFFVVVLLGWFVPEARSFAIPQGQGKPAEITSPATYQRIPWTQSRIKGTPDPPLPYVIERVFEEVKLTRPTEMIRLPGTDRWVVTELGGKIKSFSNSLPRNPQLALDLKSVSPDTFRVLGITFHHEFPDQPYCYVAYADKMKSPEGAKLARFRVSDPAIPLLDPSSETVLLNWNSTDHNGGSLHFGPDKYLYLSIGDGQNPNPPDPSGTGQDITDVQASILRIDVDEVSDNSNYGIPADNPFVAIPAARGEVWAFGLRNPWKMAFHPQTGELWTGDVGWEMREMIYRIHRGANYGWSVMEGSQVVKPNAVRSPIPITPPVFEHDHTESRSITGGYFWQNRRLPELDGAYIYGDWMTGKIWGLKHDGERVTWQKELADTPLQIISFALTQDGEVLTVGYDGSIHKLISNPVLEQTNGQNSQFPTLLSETGVFSSTGDLDPAPGVIPYTINAHHWSDHTYSQQWIGLPGDAKLSVFDRSNWEVGQVAGNFSFPPDTVLVKTVLYRERPQDPGSERRLETQVLHRYLDDWNAYNYVWNEDQTDAILQENVATESILEIVDPGEPTGVRQQTWLHASRDQCKLCHIWSSGTAHGFKLYQLNRPDAVDPNLNQLEKFERLGIFESPVARPSPAISPLDSSQPLADRARQYLDLNCAHCHRRGGGGTAAFVLNHDVPLEKADLVDAPAMQGDFGIPAAKIISAGRPEHSVLLYRMLKSGRGHMPQFGPSLVDDQGVRLINDWIASLGPRQPGENAIAQQIEDLDLSSFAELLPTNGTSKTLPLQTIKQIEKCFQEVPTAIALAIRCSSPLFPRQLRKLIAIQAAVARPEVRDLFERFLPPDQRTKTLGSAIDIEALLAVQGNAERGRALYDTLTCQQCHQIGESGKMVGPDLTRIGAQRTRLEILESILSPSEKIEDKFRGLLVITSDGDVISGFKLSETTAEIQMVDAEGNVHPLRHNDIEDIRAMKKSLMPEQLLAELTEQQAADLLSFLSSLKQSPIDDEE